jgi:hypothetical protein
MAAGKNVVKVGRNDPCPCGSGKKYKHCCERKTTKMPLGNWVVVAALIAAAGVLVFVLIDAAREGRGSVGASRCPPGQIWSPEHGHCHAPGAR